MSKIRKKNKKCYLVLNEKNGYMYGAFPYSPEGLALATKYIKDKVKSSKEKLYITEK